MLERLFVHILVPDTSNVHVIHNEGMVQLKAIRNLDQPLWTEIVLRVQVERAPIPTTLQGWRKRIRGFDQERALGKLEV
eukprot:scaffold2800_cov135-Isochrysis_galbana.AAC.5